MSTVTRCYACDRKLGKSPKLVDTRDDQLVYAGSECFKQIIKNKNGWQPPKGGPKLYLIGILNMTQRVYKITERHLWDALCCIWCTFAALDQGNTSIRR
jgi:hypothetical protein